MSDSGQSRLDLSGSERALVDIGRALRAAGYHFVTPTPETHRRVNERFVAAGRAARTLRDIFGWSRPFRRADLDARLLTAVEQAEIIAPTGDADLVTARVRFSTLDGPDGELMFAHASYPTVETDAVFFGPDSYRFARWLAQTVTGAQRVIDVGCGTGVGGIVLARRSREVVLADVSARALELAAVNVALAGLDDGRVTVRASDVLDGVDGEADVIVTNPPYVVGPEDKGAGRLYRDGGGELGIDLADRIARDAVGRLGRRGGRLLLYTGVPIIEAANPLRERLEPLLRERAARWTWQELDPDVFGEELDRPAYRRIGAERLAVVALDATVEPAPLPPGRLSPS